MPENAARVKQENVRALRRDDPLLGHGRRVAREAMCAEVERETGATMIHPFDNADVIAGQGTAALELLEDVPDLDA